ncbi:uncharacterized protein KY384_008393 [Bacidia gigantensis]|uniref:uncharacterized protein n=1 Tax=Bacidia gigantensis TaxID=2732470 RepID=UPI001D045213|nr:uncharacterized protein KY384_008393 [Bacidia gigantensis]KAG8526964.1 hypothetical protein KY384_008393 [Bacidia gigantensis]
MEGTTATNGMARTATRKRRSSGTASQQSPIISDIPNLPVAPEVPKTIPSSYRSPSDNANADRSSNTYPGSFAQRAAILTGRSLPPDPNNNIATPPNPPSGIKSERRTSLNRPIGGVYSEIQQHARDSWGKSPTSPRRISFSATPQEAQAKNPASPALQDTCTARSRQAGPTPTSDQPKSSRSTTVTSRDTSDKWASDRSPLQKLEVKLTDISKEEKRARVEQAEQRLRDSKVAAQKKAVESAKSREGIPPIRTSATESRARHSSSNYPQESKFAPASNRVREDPSIHEPNRDAVQQQRRATSDNYPDRGVRFRNQDRSPELDAESDIKEEDTGLYQSRGPSVPTDTISTARQTRHPSMPSTSRQVLPEQKKLYSNKAQPSQKKDSEAAYGGISDAVSARQVSTGRTPRHEIPPQTAAGIRARQRVGFGNNPLLTAEVPTQRKHHLSNIMHHAREQTPEPVIDLPARPNHLNEWKNGGVARLTADDFLDNSLDESPWWEQQGSNARRRSQRNSVGFQDPYQEGNGESSLISLPQSIQTREKTPQTRQYVTAEETKDNAVVRLRNNLSSLSQRLKGKETIELPLTYSYSCTSLADHHPFHSNHICEPYLSKELMKSMRSVRIRAVPASTTFSPPLFLKCGPLLRYTGMRIHKIDNKQVAAQKSDQETWRGSVMIVTNDADSTYDPVPVLRLFPEPMEKLPPPQRQQAEHEKSEDLPHHYMDPVAGLPKLSRTGKTVYVKPVDDLEHAKDLSRLEGNDDGLFEDFRSAAVPTAYGTPEYRPGHGGPSPRQSRSKPKQRKGHRVKGVRLHAERGVTFWRFNIEVELQSADTRIAYSINGGPSTGFWVPGRGQTMNVMFHSCNGFSLSVNPDDFSGPDPLWRDVLNNHQTHPFHIMIGGGDQIYNDAVMRQSPLFREWLDIKNPHHKHEVELSPALLEELETFYLERYSMWFSQGLFGMANAQIPMVNIWDDHDIIDGFGSYPHHFMSTPVFCGLGSVAFKYYMLFQHQSVPDETTADEPSWLLGASPGPYINELSRSVFVSLGKHVAFLGLDCRTERMKEEILSESSYDIIFERCRREIAERGTKHLIVLLGVPIAYPRLVWLENLLTSKALDPLKAMGRMGLLGNVMNKFDGGVEILDDLDDHWTARNHKRERNWFVQELQELAADLSVRVTILGGDVHLAAIGQFFSNPKLKIPKDRDHRYMPNVVSSAIVNTPPPELMSDVLNKRNKTHHLDAETDENMIPMFSHDVDGKLRNNKRLLPRRNWCSIREYLPGSTPPPTPPHSEPETTEEEDLPKRPTPLQRTLSLTRGDVKPGNLIRRLSGRGPPNTYLTQGYDTPSPPQSPADNETFVRKSQVSRSSTAPIGEVDPQRHSSAPQRPTFLRRPTNLSEKAAHKGDPEDTNDHVNLENGLDITLHCEVDQQNPAGETTPYRILIPALFYQGEGDENTAALRRPNLLRRLTNLRDRKSHQVAHAHSEGSASQASLSGSESTEEESEEERIRPRRWSFGLEKRRRYRDQTPPQVRDSPDLKPPPSKDPKVEAQRLGQFRDRPQGQLPSPPHSQQKYKDTRRQADILDAERAASVEEFEVPPSRHAKRYEALDGSISGDESPARQRLDSIDYHDYVDPGNKRQSGAPPARRLSKADKMLGSDVPIRVNSGHDQDMYDDAYRMNSAESGPGSKRTSGYSGIEAYSDEKKGWRKSLKFF